jgi:phenylacetate-coenzyme A ligase PaaK-like adenylate-forming protein
MEFKALNELLQSEVFGSQKSAAHNLFIQAMEETVTHHFENCEPYRRLCNKRGFDPRQWQSTEQIPYLPTAIFKDAPLLSIPAEEVFRIISSSATTTGRPSRVSLDKATSRRQSKCFNKVVLERLGNKKRKFIVLDLPETVGRSTKVSARASTIRSLLFGASSTDTVIEESSDGLLLNKAKLNDLLSTAEKSGEEIVIFGFTYILYHYVVKKLLDSGVNFSLADSKIIHIGGWKKLESEKVSPEQLINESSKVFGIKKGNVVDFYGFTEQSGMVYPTCEEGLRHVPSWGDVIIRDQMTLEPLPKNKEGLLQFLTPIQTSYPGHSILTEDLGILTGIDDCKCGRKGKTFKVIGRAAKAEIRGCGDIMAEKFA